MTMWEVISANKRNSIILIAIMAAVLLSLGYVIGQSIEPARGGGSFGIGVALIIWLVLSLVSLSSGDQILLAVSKAVPVTHDVHPQLFNIVEEMTIAANLPKAPKIYIIPDPAPNAFATGRSPKSASVAVTAGLLSRLNRDELQGVIAHEISHILHRDILFVTLAGIMLGAIVMISDIYLRSMFYSSMGSQRRRYSSDSGGGQGQAQAILMIIAIVCAILAPLLAYLLYFALSRKREYLADAGGARLTRYPEGLASALEKIADSNLQLASANKVTAPMYIVNPLHAAGKKLSDLTSTHPPISKRIQILRNMSQGASFRDYSQAFSLVTHGRSIVPPSALAESEPVKVRAESDESGKTQQEQIRQAGDLIQRLNLFTFVTCSCGLKMKIPPNFKSDRVNCPRCGVVNTVR